MARLAVFASGNGTNFQAIAERMLPTRHEMVCLYCDRRRAGAVERAAALGVPVRHISYKDRSREEVEEEIADSLQAERIELIALAGYMRILSPALVDRFPRRITNIHPSLLPRHPGLNAIQRSFEAGDPRLGITIHYVDHGVDTGPVIRQEAFERPADATLEEVEARIHELEHRVYPEVIMELLDSIDSSRPRPAEPQRRSGS